MKLEVLSIDELTKNSPDQAGLHRLSLQVKEHETVTIYAPATTEAELLLHLLTGREQPATGDIKLLSKDLQDYSRVDLVRTLGVLDQSTRPYERLTVREYLVLFTKLFGLPPERLQYILSSVGLLDRQKTRVRQLSTNFLARLNLARACLHQPRLLVLERPTAGLDLDTTELLRRFLRQEVKQGAAALVITNDIEEAEALGDRVFMLRGGKLKEITRTDDEEQPDQQGEGDNPEAAAYTRHKACKVAARLNDRTILFDPTEIIYISTEEGITMLHVEGAEMPCPLTLTDLEQRLTPFGFFRCHRSYLVNLQRVREVVPWTRSSFSLLLDDSNRTTIPMSKNGARELDRLLGLKE